MAYGNIAAIGPCTYVNAATVDNDAALMGDDNIVHICGKVTNTTLAAGSRLLTLPSTFPTNASRKVMNCPVENQNATPKYRTMHFVLASTNILYACEAIASDDIVYLNQMPINFNGQFYSTATGNISGFTSPITAR